MPNWKKLIISGSDASLNSLNLTSTPNSQGVFLTKDSQGLISSRTAAQVLTDIGAAASGSIIQYEWILKDSQADQGISIISGDAVVFNGINGITTTRIPGSGGGIEIEIDGSGIVVPSISGSLNFIPKYDSPTGLIESQIFDNGTDVGINTLSPTNKLDVNGTARIRTLNNNTGDFVTANANGVLSRRTAAQVLTDIDAVPYTGATKNVDLGNFGLTTNHIKYNISPVSIPTDKGTTYWNVDENALSIILNGYIMTVGEDQFYPVKNQTGNNILKGTNVRFAGTVGMSGRLLIAPFIADNSVPSQFYMGVTAEDIPDGEDGKVLWFGRIRGINTNAFAEGDVLYASTTVAGGFQTQVPVAPNNIIQVAAVITKSSTVGTIFVRPTIGSNINKDEGVKITTPTTGNILQLQSNGLWENKTLSQAGIQPTLTNPITGTGTSGQVSFFNGTTTQTGDNGLFWDNSNKRLGIGTTSPNRPLDVRGTVTIDPSGNFTGSPVNDLFIYNEGSRNTGRITVESGHPGGVPAYRMATLSDDGTKRSGGLFMSAGVFGGNDETVFGFSSDDVDFQFSIWRNQNVYVGAGLSTVPTERLQVGGRVRIETIDNGTGDFATISGTGVITRRTAAQVLSDIGAQASLTNPITGTGSSGQVSFFNGTTTQTGDNGLFWNNTNKRLGIGTTSPSEALTIQGKISINDGGNSVFIGTQAGDNDDGSDNKNVGVGHQALLNNTTGVQNTANGSLALRDNTTGDNNTATGHASLLNNTTGVQNTANGYAALLSNTTGNNNTANGFQAGRRISNGGNNETGNNSVFIGYDTRALNNGETNQIVIGYEAVGLGSNTVVLGNNSITKTALKGDVGIGTTSPSEKLHVSGRARITTIDNGTGDFATISGTGVITRRTAAQVLSDINAASTNLGSGWETGIVNNLTGFNSSAAEVPVTGTHFGFLSTLVGNTSFGGAFIMRNNRSFFQTREVGTLQGWKEYWHSGNLTNPITGTGTRTTNFMPKFSGTNTITNSQIFDDGTSVGIGTTTPNGKLQINQGTNLNVAINTVTNDATTVSRISSLNDAATASMPLVINGNRLVFTTDTVERMRISSAGDVGINETSPSERLHVNGRARITTIDNGTGDFATISGTGVITRRTAAQVLSDIGAQPSGDYVTLTGNQTIGGTKTFSSTIVGSINGNAATADALTSGDKLIDGQLRVVTVNNGVGNFVTLSGSNTLTKRTSAEVLSDIGAQASLTNPITGTGTAGQVSFWNGTTTQTGDNGLFWDNSTKRLGIGTGSPVDLLHIASSTTDARMVLDSASGFDSELKFFENGVAKYTIGHDAASGNFVVGTVNVDINQRFVINSLGNVGIGTTSPTSRLEISGTTGNYNSGIGFVPSGTGARSYRTFIANDGSFRFDDTTSGATRLTLNSSGNLGIGTTSPSRRLHISSSSPDGIALQNTAGQTYNITSGIPGVTNGGLAFAEGSTVRLFIDDTSGNVGIGTTSPSTELQVGGNSRIGGGGDLELWGNGSNRTGANSGRLLIRFNDETVLAAQNEQPLALSSFGTNSSIQFRTGSTTERMRITSTGDVGIGNTANLTGGGRLQVSGDVNINKRLLSGQENLSVDTGALRVIATISSSDYNAAFFDFVIKKGDNLRAGTVYAVHDGSLIEFTETSTNDLGNTNEVTLTVDLSGGNIRLLAKTDTNGWEIKTMVRGI